MSPATDVVQSAAAGDCNRLIQELLAQCAQPQGKLTVRWLRAWERKIIDRLGVEWVPVLRSISTYIELRRQVGDPATHITYNNFDGARIEYMVANMSTNSGKQITQAATGNIVEGDDSSMHAGRDMKAVSGGQGNIAVFKDITFYEQHVAQLQVPAELQSALVAARKQLDSLVLPPVVKEER